MYRVADDVSRDTTITLSLQNAPFQAALDAVCQAAGLKYDISADKDVYTFSPSLNRQGSIIINRNGERLSWKLSNADPAEALKQLLSAFEKKYDVNLKADPNDELTDLARRIGADLQAISQMTAAEQIPRLKDLKGEADRYLKPPKVVSSTVSKSLTVDGNVVSFTEAMDILSGASGFLWFRRPDGKIVVRQSTTADQVRSIFQREHILDALLK